MLEQSLMAKNVEGLVFHEANLNYFWHQLVIEIAE